MKVIRTIRETIETEVDLPHLKAKLRLGDWVEHRTGPRFRITDMRYNGDLARLRVSR